MTSAKTSVDAPGPVHERIDIYCDGPTLEEMVSLDRRVVRGFTFNPTLFKSLGVRDYLAHGRRLVEISGGLPLSLEVFADEEAGMVRQAEILSSLGESVFVKIPVTFTSGATALPVIRALAEKGTRLNITALFTLTQVQSIIAALRDAGAILSVFAGRLYDIGRDAAEDTTRIVEYVRLNSNCRVLWASPRMVYDVKSAIRAGCDIITMQAGLIKKLSLFEKTPEEYSLDTVRMFHQDALISGYRL